MRREESVLGILNRGYLIQVMEGMSSQIRAESRPIDEQHQEATTIPRTRGTQRGGSVPI